jgi:hypothetical protein
MAGEPLTDDARQRQHGTAGAVAFVVGLCSAGAVLIVLSAPIVWGILATVGLAVAAVRMVRDIRGNRAM